ncbi:MAG TPA: M50 family metallopeptidase [archaeon]|nr:M50 family metallopeptidase [archaeon]
MKNIKIKNNFIAPEWAHFLASAAALGFALGGPNLNGYLISFAVVVALLFLHDFAGHKFAASRYGVKAEIKFWPVGSAIGILTSFFGIILTPPSYVFINEKKTVEPKKNFKKDFGIIALAGPAVNIFAAAVLIALSSFSPGIFLYAAKISFLIATINLLPVGSLDGLKIARWSWVVWLASIILAAGGFVLIR